MEYVQLTFVIDPYSSGVSEMLTAGLDNLGYESFQEEEPYLLAFIPEERYDRSELDRFLDSVDTGTIQITIREEIIPDINWNEEWERNYVPVVVEGVCAVRAPFHQPFPGIPNIIIEPRMSFGTGHHETTRLMLRHTGLSSLEGIHVLDMGCGTGILGIFALMAGAKHVTAIDTDEWARNNSLENFRNNIPDEHQYEVIRGNASSIPARNYQMILANINRNIILNDLPAYVRHLSPQGSIILSGFLDTDRQIVAEKARSLALTFVTELYEKNWISLKFRS